MTSTRLLLWTLIFVAAVGGMTAAIVLQPAFAPIATTTLADFDVASRERDARVVALGDCMAKRLLFEKAVDSDLTAIEEELEG